MPSGKMTSSGHLSLDLALKSTKIIVNDRLVFSWFFDIHRNLGNVKEKPTRKTCFSREKKHPAPRIYQAKFCLAAFL